MDLGIAGRRAIVAASSRGLGLGAAKALAADGVDVAMSARTEADLERAADEVRAHAAAAGYEPTIATLAIDVTAADAGQHLVDHATTELGGVDIVVANAGGPDHGGPFDHDDAAYLAAFEANALSAIRLFRAARPAMTEAGWGRMVAITSRTIKQPVAPLALSNTARTALYAWAKTAAPELFAQGITLNLACPGLHRTDRMIELGIADDAVAGDPDDFGAAVAFLCSEQAKFIAGTTLSVDGCAITALL